MEGPSLRALYYRIKKLNGTSSAIEGGTISLRGNVDLIPYGKRLIIRAGTSYIKVFFGMSGTGLQKKLEKTSPSLTIRSEDGMTVYFYKCSIAVLSLEEFKEYYKPETDVMDIKWNPVLAKEKILAAPRDCVSDILLNQDIFCGSGNIVKNEVLWRTQLNPLEKIDDISDQKIDDIIKETGIFSHLFFNARLRGYGMRKILGVYREKVCHVCDSGIRKEHLGTARRVTYWCPVCQDFQ